MSDLLSVDEALARMLAAAQPAGVERLPVDGALGRALGEDVVLDVPSPPFDNSAVDGWAVRAADCAAAPVTLPARGESVAGDAPGAVLEAGTACRILTGAPIPAGADCVVMQEDVEIDGGGVRIAQPPRAGANFRAAGSDMRAGDTVCRAGEAINPARVALLATAGRTRVLCGLRPRVALLTTGDEVEPVEEGRVPAPGRLRNTNGPALAALARSAGADVVLSLHAPDSREGTLAALRACAASGAHLIVSAGGVSVGDRDFVKPAVEELGALTLWRIAMRPGKPVAFGRVGDALFLGLPGNPVSAMVTFVLFGWPLLRRIGGFGAPQCAPAAITVELAEPIPHARGRREFARARLSVEGGRTLATVTGPQGSGMLGSMAAADVLVVLSEDRGNYAAGETVPALLLPW